jgi:hypothetical protein
MMFGLNEVTIVKWNFERSSPAQSGREECLFVTVSKKAEISYFFLPRKKRFSLFLKTLAMSDRFKR